MKLLAGAAFADITPHEPTALYGYPHAARISTGVHDPLLATVLALRRGDTTVVMASLDLLMIEPAFARELRQAVARALRCDPAGVLASCTHTHSGPVTSRLIGWASDPAVPSPDPDYLAFVKSQLCAAAAEALQAAAPAEYACTTADATGVGGNRLGAGGVTDPECGVLALRRRADRQLLALALIYGMHPTVLHEDSTLVSADFPHYTRLHLSEHLGRAVPISYHNAPSGNQSPRRFVTGQTFAEAERLGRLLGEAVRRALEGISADEWHDDVTLDGRLTSLSLPRNPPPSPAAARRLLADCRARFAALRRENAPHAAQRTAECAVFGAESAVALASAHAAGELDDFLRAYDPVETQMLRLGEMCLVGLPGECFTEYALEIKRRSPSRTFVISLANGDLQGYIVTPQAAAAGGYEAANALFAPASGARLAASALDMIAASYRSEKP